MIETTQQVTWLVYNMTSQVMELKNIDSVNSLTKFILKMNLRLTLTIKY
jgi:hypothetical protein